ncbi:MAG TPA: thioredoxin family protein [Opitutaceae bacterium]|nr:thioredoxin family protein [Opitutaceae bacterium]
MRLLLLLSACLSASLPVFAVKNGDTLATVLDQKGEPRSKLERGNVTVLTYEDGTVKLENGVVVAQTLPGADYAVRANAPTPRRTTGGGSSGPGFDGEWTTDYQSAASAAQGTGREVLLFFTGSDWCGWCKRLEAEVLGTEEFKEYASGNLALVKLDFPRRVAQSEFTKSRNRELQQKYGIEGYPTIVVLNDAGEEVGRLGYQAGGPGPFIKKLRKM